MEPLFPVSSENSGNDNPPKHLFPSFSSFPVVQGAGNTQTSIPTDWLENKSFPLGFPVSNSFNPEEFTGTEAENSLQRCGDQRKDAVHEESSSEEEDKQEWRKRKKKEKSRHKKKKHKHKHDQEREEIPKTDFTQEHDRKVKLYGNKVFIEEIMGLEAKDAFRVDRKSNDENWNYQSIYKGHIAKFYDNFMSSMGSQGDRPVHMKERVDKEKHKDKRRYYGRENAKAASMVPMERFQQKSNNGSSFLYVPEVIPLPKDKKDIVENSHQTSNIRDRLLDTGTKHYVEGKGVIKDGLDEISADVLAAQRKVAEYNKRLKEEPNNVALWLDFLNFQDRKDLITANVDKSEGKVPRLALHEKKVAIMKKAMDVNPGNVELKLKYLELCRETWEPHEINKELESMLFVHPTNLLLWQHFLLFNQCRLSTFSVSRMCKLYQKCLKTLQKYGSDGVHTVDSAENIPEKMLVILQQYFSFLRQVGHTERAVATFQALVEFNTFCPSKYRSESREDRVALFESFWDSGVPRIGEEDAKGWSFWAEKKVMEPKPKSSTGEDLTEKEQSVISEDLPKWQTWIKIEKLRTSHHWLPWRPDLTKDETEDDCEDIDRLVIFDDISPFLFDIPPSLYFDLILKFLSALGITQSIEMSKNMMSQLLMDELSGVCHLQQLGTLLDNSELKFSLAEHFVSLLCQQMSDVLNTEQLTELTLMMLDFKFERNRKVMKDSALHKSVRTMCKTALKEPRNRENVDIWMKYATLLWRCGQNQEAISTLEMAISLLGAKHGKGVTPMYRILSELYLGFEEPGKAITLDKKDKSVVSQDRGQHAFVCMVEGKHQEIKKSENFTSTVVLRCRKKMEAQVNEAWEAIDDEGQTSEACLISFLERVKCKAMFEYSCTPSNVEPSLSDLNLTLTRIYKYADSHNVSFQELEDRNRNKHVGAVSKLISDLFRYKIRIIHHHMSTKNYPLHHLRNVIDSALEMFPSDMHFLQAFLDCERGSHILGRVDRYFSKSLTRVASPVPVVYGVMSQLLRMDQLRTLMDTTVPMSDSGPLHRIRAYLEKGLDQAEVQHCPLLWRLYLCCEVKCDHVEKAKGIFYRALQQCPWSKSIYMDAVQLFGEEKLQEILDLMMEKELRIQIPLEEIDIMAE